MAKKKVSKKSKVDQALDEVEVTPVLDNSGVTDVFKVDPKKLKNGIWVDIEGTGDKENDIPADKILVAHVENLKFLKLVEKEIKKRQAASKLNKKEVSPVDRAMITLEMVAEHRILDWEINGFGEYSSETAYDMLLLSPQFDRFVNQVSTDLTNFYRDVKEANEKK